MLITEFYSTTTQNGIRFTYEYYNYPTQEKKMNDLVIIFNQMLSEFTTETIRRAHKELRKF